MLAASKAKAGAGGLSSASPGTGTSPHMALELLAYQSGVKFTHVPYKGSGPAVQDVMGGQVDMMFDTALVVGPHIQSGKLRPIAVSSSKRLESLPDVPTIAEAGLPGYAFETWFIVFAPAGTPKPIIDKLNATLNQALGTPALKERMTKDGFEPIPSTPEQARARLEQEMPQWAKLIKERGITAE